MNERKYEWAVVTGEDSIVVTCTGIPGGLLRTTVAGSYSYELQIIRN